MCAYVWRGGKGGYQQLIYSGEMPKKGGIEQFAHKVGGGGGLAKNRGWLREG